MLLLLSCTGPAVIQVGTTNTVVEDSTGGSETGLPTIPSTDTDTATTTTEPVETWPKDCDALYDPSLLPTFDLEISQQEWNGLRSDCNSGIQNYRPVKFTYEGETVDAMARLKGNWTWNCDKMQFVISFNEVDSTARFHGLRKIMLDAPWYDQTMLHERLAFAMFQWRGLPYSCANSARLQINGSYYGLYSNVERVDHEYLERNFEDASGNLYQAGGELKTNEDIGNTQDITSLQAARTVEELDALMDLDEALAEWATEAVIPAMDNYWAGVEINYYLYDHPTQGFVYLPYDMDLSFGDSKYTDGSLVWPDTLSSDPITYEHPGWRKEDLFKTVLANKAWCEKYVEQVRLARDAYVPADMQADITTWDAQISAALDEDPHKPYSSAAHDNSVRELKKFLENRADFVDQWLAQGGHCPARW